MYGIIALGLSKRRALISQKSIIVGQLVVKQHTPHQLFLVVRTGYTAQCAITLSPSGLWSVVFH